jgi:hypothetical protein
MMRTTILAAVGAALCLAYSGCSSDSGTTTGSRSEKRNTSPPSVDLGESSSTLDSSDEENAAESSSGQANTAGSASKTAGGSSAPSSGGWGALTGRFVYDGPAPERKPVTITKDPEFCGKTPPLVEDVVVNPENGGIQNVVVMLYVKPRQKAPAAHPDYAAQLSEPVRLDNVNCRFEPHICVVRAGQKLIIGNKDEVGHNTKADLAGAPFNELIGAGNDVEKSINSAERAPAPVGCNIHPWMSAYMVVAEHPYVAVTDQDGNFKIENLPTGEWTFQVWQEKAGYVENVSQDGKAQEWSKGRPTFTIAAGENNLGEIKVAPAVFQK